MLRLSLEDKLFFFERNFFTLDGLWMIESERETNWDTALKIDIHVWIKLLKIIFRRLSKYLEIERNSLDSIVRMLVFRWSAEGWKFTLKKGSENQFKFEINGCPYKSNIDRNPERIEKQSLICKNMCLPFYKAAIQESNRNINVVRNRFMGLGDSICNFILFTGKSAFLDKNVRWRQVPIKKIQKENKLFYFEQNFRTLDGLWIIAVENEINWETALKLDIFVWQRLYKIIFKRVKKYLELEGNTLEELLKILSFTWNCEGNDHEIIIDRPNGATIHMTKCPYVEAMSRNPERHKKIASICKEMCIPYLDPVITDFNPNIKLERKKFIGIGDEICDFHFELTS